MNASNQPSNDKLFIARSLEATIHIGLVVLLLYWCFKIGQPFIEIIVWGIIIAVAIHPGYDRLNSALGGRGRLTATLITLLALILLLVLILAVVQLPTILILGPIIVYVFSTSSTVIAVVFAIFSILVGISDAFLKPLLMGRGVDVTMLVIFIGAIGGFMVSSIIGLFVGAVILALGYKLFLAWLNEDTQPERESSKSE